MWQDVKSLPMIFHEMSSSEYDLARKHHARVTGILPVMAAGAPSVT
jgi:hypothetical protein